jgi:hypothetical protein
MYSEFGFYSSCLVSWGGRNIGEIVLILRASPRTSGNKLSI